ncbi:MAG: TlpA disulfide reductase family protein [Aquabacterium sp.]
MSACSDAGPSAPDLPFTQLDGAQHRLADLKGKVTLVNFWATSCSTCVKEMPQLIATHQKFQNQGFETLAVAMQYDPPAYVSQFAQTRKLPFRVAVDHDGKLAEGFGSVQLTPTTFLLDKQGRIVKKYIGEPDFAALHQLVAQLLAQG